MTDRVLTVGSLFSGVGGFEMGLERAGFQVLWQVEIDKDAVSVLERHWPATIRYRDVREVDGAVIEPVDVICGGFPCQDVSVAGKQTGLAGSRSGLFWEAVRIVREMRADTEGRYPAVVIFENVPGLLSTNGGRDFAAVLRGLGELGAAVAWRILDAQFFGVPQRRRRVFIVADFAPFDLGEQRAAEILSLTESLCRHPAPGGETGQGATAAAEGSAGSRGVTGKLRSHPRPGSNDVGSMAAVSVPLTAAMGKGHVGQDDHTPGFLLPVPLSQQPDTDECRALAAGTGGPGSQDWQQHAAVIVGSQAVAHCLTAHGGSHQRQDAESETFVVAAPLSAGSHPNSNAPGRHREDDQNLIVATDTADTLSVGANQTTGYVGDDIAHVARAVSASYGNGSPRGDGADNLVASFDERQVTSAANRSRCDVGLPAGTLHGDPLSLVVFHATQTPVSGQVSPSLGASAQIGVADLSVTHSLTTSSGVTEDGTGRGTPRVASPGGVSVRRLMPVETERLQGWSDGHTERRADGSLLSDGVRYRLVGNGVAAPVAEWIGRRLRAVMEGKSGE